MIILANDVYFLMKLRKNCVQKKKRPRFCPRCRHFGLISQQHTGCYTCKSRCQSSQKSIPCFFDSGSHKINAHGIKNCLRTAHHHRCQKTCMGIRPKLLIHVQQQTRCRAGRKHTDDRKWHQASRKNLFRNDPIQQSCQHIQKSGGTQHSGSNHQPHQSRSDLYHCIHSLPGPAYKAVIDWNLRQQSVSHNIKDQKRNNELRQIHQKLHERQHLKTKLSVCVCCFSPRHEFLHPRVLHFP